jgi:hypothetical protein
MKMTVPDRATRSCGGVAIAASLVLAAAALFPTGVAADSTDSTATSATATSVRADSVSTTADRTDASTRASADTVGKGARTHHRDHDVGRHDVGRSDGKATVRAAGARHAKPNTACAPATQSTGVARCPAAETPPATNVAAPPSTTGDAGGGAGSAAGAAGGGTLPPPLTAGPRSVRHTTTAPSSAHSATAKGPATAPRPALLLPSPPSTSTFLGPVPLLVPIIDGVASEVGALPLQWLVLLTIIDLGLIVAIVLRRRRGRCGADGGVS